MKVLLLILITGLLGSILKILGGALYGSNALFVDALTSVSNVIALLFAVFYSRKAYIPPDSDHHFGHERFEYTSVLLTILAYSFVVGIAAIRLYYVREYSIQREAVLLAILAMVTYAIAIKYSIKQSPAFRTYGVFTASELIEGVIGIVAVIGGVFIYYVVDYVGAIVLTTYISYEIIKETKKLVNILVDVAPSNIDYYKVIEELKKEGIDVKRLRLRLVSSAKIHGDAVISVKDRKAVTRVKRKLSSMGIDLCIEVVD